MDTANAKTPRLLRTTAVRLAIRYALTYALILAVVVAAVWWMTGRHVSADMQDALQDEIEALAEVYEQAGSSGLSAALGKQPDNRLSVLVSGEGEKLGGNLIEWPEDGPDTDGKVAGQWIDDDALAPSMQFEDDIFGAVVAIRLDDGSKLMLADPIAGSDGLEETTELLGIVLVALGFAILIGLVMSIFVSRQVLKRLLAISHTADEIMAGELTQRIPISDKGDEFDAVAVRLNAMLDRIQQLVKGIREVTDNIAHDLRSPLTRLRNRMEITLMEPRDSLEYQEALEEGMQEADGLIKTFNALLSIAQVEAGNHRSEWGPVRVDKLADDLVDLYAPLAEEKHQTLEFHNGKAAELIGSRDLLISVLHNLLENAIKYTPEYGRIVLSISSEAQIVEIAVSDTGPGIPEADQERVLQRFVRLEGSRHTHGNGLGLSLVYAVARLHKAKLTMTNTHPGFRIALRIPKKI